MSFHVPSDAMEGAFIAYRQKHNVKDSYASASSNHSEESQSNKEFQVNSGSKSNANSAAQKHDEDEEYRVANSVNAHDDAKLGIDNGDSQLSTSKNAHAKSNSTNKANVDDTTATNTDTASTNNSDNNTTNVQKIPHHMTQKQAQSPSNAKKMKPQTASNKTKSILMADIGAKNYSDAKDYKPQQFTESGYTHLLRAISTIMSSYQDHSLNNKENVKSIIQNLTDFAKQWRQVLKILWSVHNNSINKLQRELDAFKSSKNGLNGVNVPHQVGIILQWARTGVPAKLDADFQKIDSIAHDPQFIAWSKQNKANKGLGIPQPLMTRYNKIHLQRKQRQAKQSSAANSKNNN